MSLETDSSCTTKHVEEDVCISSSSSSSSSNEPLQTDECKRPERPVRTRKAPAALPQESVEPVVQPLQVVAGKGTAFRDIPFVSSELKSCQRSSTRRPLLTTLHRVVFPGLRVYKATCLENLEAFSGIPASADVNLYKQRLLALHNDVLQTLADVLGVTFLANNKTKETRVDALLAFLEAPKDLGRTPLPKGTKRKQASKASSSTPRTPTGYQMFCKEQRPQLKASGLKFAEIAKRLGEMWGALSKEEQHVYVLRGAAFEPSSDDSQKKTSTTTKKKKTSASTTKKNKTSTTTKKKKTSKAAASSTKKSSSEKNKPPKKKQKKDLQEQD